MRCWLLHGDWQALSVARAWFYEDHWAQAKAWIRRRSSRMPRRFIIAEWVGVFRGIFAYFASRRAEKRWARKHREQPPSAQLVEAPAPPATPSPQPTDLAESSA
jgi:hypothetical protein